jgi:hypothetical protein
LEGDIIKYFFVELRHRELSGREGYRLQVPFLVLEMAQVRGMRNQSLAALKLERGK